MNGNNKRRFIISVITAVILMLLTACGSGNIDAVDSLYKIQRNTVEILMEQVPEPTINSVGGEWTVIALVKSENEIDEGYIQRYYDRVSSIVSSQNGDVGSRFTDYARVSLALTAIGRSPEDICGYNLLDAVNNDYDFVVSQGINGPVYALIAANECGYELNEKSELKYLDYILDQELDTGGFSFDKSSTAMDVDITAMVLQALSKYQDNENVKNATDRAVASLSKAIKKDSGYDSSEAYSQVIIALTILGINPMSDDRFSIDGQSIVDELMNFALEDGTFCHEADGKSNLMATEQALCALDACVLFTDNRTFY